MVEFEKEGTETSLLIINSRVEDESGKTSLVSNVKIGEKSSFEPDDYFVRFPKRRIPLSFPENLDRQDVSFRYFDHWQIRVEGNLPQFVRFDLARILAELEEGAKELIDEGRRYVSVSQAFSIENLEMWQRFSPWLWEDPRLSPFLLAKMLSSNNVSFQDNSIVWKTQEVEVRDGQLGQVFLKLVPTVISSEGVFFIDDRSGSVNLGIFSEAITGEILDQMRLQKAA